MKKCFLIFIFFFLCSNVYALELCTPSSEYTYYSNLDSTEKEKYIEPIYCSEIMDTKLSGYGYKDSFFNNILSRSILSANETAYSSSYNAYLENFVNPPQSQQQTGLCWDFSALSVVEANALKNNIGNYDFSEAHLAYSILAGLYSDNDIKKSKFNSDTTGGQLNYAPTYFFNGYGQLLENELNFNDSLVEDKSTLKTIDSSNYLSGNKLISIENFELYNMNSNGICTDDEIDTIKQKILDYGSVQATMFMDEDLFLDYDSDYYISTTSNSTNSNHAVAIVGWDDTISKSNFNGATRDGAFIIKNSWGTNWSNDGFFYISYDDNFICKQIAAFSGISNKTFDYSYSASDVVGSISFRFSNTEYISSKFSKESESLESLDRVSFAVGDNMSYKVYLSKENDILDKTNWILLSSGTSDFYGIKSVDLNDVNLLDDFTIIVEYDVDAFKQSSVFTTCNSSYDTLYLDISSDTNFISSNGSNWTDLSDITVENRNFSCEPNIYAYTNISEVVEKLEIVSIENSNDTLSAKVNLENINTDNITFNILDKDSNDVTNHFTITPDYNNKLFKITSDNLISGTFTFSIYYNNLSSSIDFTLDEIFELVENSSMSLENSILKVSISKNQTFGYNELLSNLNIKNTSFNLYNLSNSVVQSNEQKIGTGFKISTNNNYYYIVINGDVNGDGKISALDYIAIRKHIIGIGKIEDTLTFIASDMNNDNKISALDYIAIRKIMIG